MRIPIEKMQPRGGGGGTIGDHFDAIDTDRDGLISFADIFAHAEVTEGEVVPPDAEVTVAAADATERETQRAAEAQRRAEEEAASLALARLMNSDSFDEQWLLSGKLRVAARLDASRLRFSCGLQL